MADEQDLIQKRVQEGSLLTHADQNDSNTFVDGEEYVLGFPPTDIPAGATSYITVRPMIEAFVPQRIFVPPAVAGWFEISNIWIGKNTQFASQHPVSAVLFSGVQGLRMKMDLCQPHMDIRLGVTNISEALRRFSATVTGPPLPRPSIADEELRQMVMGRRIDV